MDPRRGGKDEERGEVGEEGRERLKEENKVGSIKEKEEKKGAAKPAGKEKPVEERPGSKKKGREEVVGGKRPGGKSGKEPGRELSSTTASPESDYQDHLTDSTVEPELQDKYRRQLHQQASLVDSLCVLLDEAAEGQAVS
ncbi:cilia- and flagella-associated protein 251-like [Coregonus clupeaformis]|uniref:cilia- and flagella-associated protein 251-like n=1 Tax=Coregonus clupeaformis TaxID=59861 RepID=UPI001E1C3DB4|nr:cilia- and flagella-associated protein 251-like [Coregonus clupeaformis]